MRNLPRTPWIDPGSARAFAELGTDAHRLCTLESGWVERLGSDALLSYQDDATCDLLLGGLREWSRAAGCSFRRIFGKFLPRQNAERISPRLLEGEAGLPSTTIVQENGVRYGIDFEAGYSAGLFLDQRHNRTFLRGRHPPRLLNTFAYTCSFSVVAAMAGAQTVSLDLSRKSLDRGEENFRLNGLDPAKHLFRADDVLGALPRLIRRQEKFNAIILDPPTFSRGEKGRRFQVEQDFESLVQQALELAAPRATILLSTNCHRLEDRDLEAIARYSLKLSRRSGSIHREPPLPDIPPASAARTIWLLLS